MMGGPRRTSNGSAKLERSIVLHVLHAGSSCSRAELATALNDTSAILLEDALTHLETQRIISLSGGAVQVTTPIRHLSLLGLIAI
jgi:hypothetical protein